MAESKAVTAKSWRSDIEGMKHEFARHLRTPAATDRFTRTLVTALHGNDDLVNADRLSLKIAVMEAAQDGLMPDGREGALVIYNTRGKPTVQWQPMVAGLMKLARNSGEIASITGHIVYRHDTFHVDYGDDENFRHVPNMQVDDDQLVEANALGAYAIAKLKDGTLIRSWRNRPQIMRVKSVSKNPNGQLWTKWWEEAWIKTAIRHLTKFLPSSTDKESPEGAFARAAERDDAQYDFGKGARDITPNGDETRSKLDQFVETQQAAAIANGEVDYDQDSGEVTQEPYQPGENTILGQALAEAADRMDVAGRPPDGETAPAKPKAKAGKAKDDPNLIPVQWPGQVAPMLYQKGHAVAEFRSRAELKNEVWRRACLNLNPELAELVDQPVEVPASAEPDLLGDPSA